VTGPATASAVSGFRHSARMSSNEIPPKAWLCFLMVKKG
jgi:hypothetical protein